MGQDIYCGRGISKRETSRQYACTDPSLEGRQQSKGENKTRRDEKEAKLQATPVNRVGSRDRLIGGPLLQPFSRAARGAARNGDSTIKMATSRENRATDTTKRRTDRGSHGIILFRLENGYTMLNTISPRYVASRMLCSSLNQPSQLPEKKIKAQFLFPYPYAA